MNKIIILLLIFLLIPFSFAGNNTSTIDTPTTHLENDKDTIIALESGDSNISFSDNYKGYCIEWGEHSAEKGNKFYIHNDVDNNLKVFFVYFYKEAHQDVIVTQHMIWKFSDNKQFSRFNQSLYDEIIAKSNTINVPNHGFIRFNSTHNMVFDFRTFVSEFEEYQDYFGYRIFFSEILNDTNIDLNESTSHNSSVNHSIVEHNLSKTLFKQGNLGNGYYAQLYGYETGVNILWLLICIMVMLSLIIIKK